LHCFEHIHQGHGAQINDWQQVNAAIQNDDGAPSNAPLVVDLLLQEAQETYFSLI